LLQYILFEKYINILALEMASPGNRHCVNCIGTLSFPVAVSKLCVKSMPLRSTVAADFGQEVQILSAD